MQVPETLEGRPYMLVILCSSHDKEGKSKMDLEKCNKCIGCRAERAAMGVANNDKQQKVRGGGRLLKI